MSDPRDPYGSSPFGGSEQPSPYQQPGMPQPGMPQPGSSGPTWGPDQPPPYQQPGPSGPAWGYGQPAGPSQPWQGGPPSQGLPGDQTAPGWGPPSQGLPGQPAPAWGPPSQGLPGAMPYAAPPTAPKRKSRRGLWITLGVILALLVLLGGGGVFAFAQYIAPATQAGVFCNDLKTQNYASAYTLLSQKLRAQLTSDQFVQASQALDKLEGPVTNCGEAAGASNAYNYTLFGSTATVTAAITRVTAGTLEGQLHLKNESGWKVDGIDTSLLGVNLTALQTAAAFCADLQAQNYTAAYGLLGSTLTSQETQTVFTSVLQLNDQIDGTVSACSLVSLGSGNSDSSASLQVSLTRSKLGQKQGTVGLDVEGGSWKVSDVASSLQGTDISAYLVMTQFCVDLGSSNYADAYSLLSSGFTGGSTEADFAAFFSGQSTDSQGFKWSGCKPDPTTYKVVGTTATVDVATTLTQLSTGKSATGTLTFTLVQSGSAWKIDDFKVKS